MSPSLYIHIPFCLKKCLYCDFVSGVFDPVKADEYISALENELSRIPRETAFSTLYIGGGTPTALSSGKLSELMRHIFSNFTFTETYEATIEANPGTVDMDKLHAIRSSGINRISLGVQSFNDDELAFLGRIHSAKDAEHAVSLAKKSGFENIGIDLIYGIPGQTLTSWENTLKNAVRLKPKHISTYELTVEEGTGLYEYLKNPPVSPFVKGGDDPPLWKRGVRGDFADNPQLPDEDNIIEMYNYTIDYLTAEGYEHYEISNFSMPGFQCRHNLNYWDRGEYFGAGLAAHSFIGHKRFHNTADLEFYISALTENKSPAAGVEEITEDKAMAETFFLGLRKTAGINLQAFSKLFGRDIMTLYGKEIKELTEAGLIDINGLNGSNRLDRSNRFLKLTRKGLLLSNEVFARFM